MRQGRQAGRLQNKKPLQTRLSESTGAIWQMLRVCEKYAFFSKRLLRHPLSSGSVVKGSKRSKEDDGGQGGFAPAAAEGDADADCPRHTSPPTKNLKDHSSARVTRHRRTTGLA